MLVCFAFTASAFGENALFVLYNSDGSVNEYMKCTNVEDGEFIIDYEVTIPENVTTIRIASCLTLQEEGIKIALMIADGEALGAYIGTLVDFEEKDSMNFNEYTWKKFTEDVDNELAELGQQIQDNMENIYDKIDTEISNSNSYTDSKFDSVNGDISDLKGTTTSIDKKYQEFYESVQKQLSDYKAEVGQYMDFDDEGLILGAKQVDDNGDVIYESPFKTLIDNTGMYFLDDGAKVAYINNKQLYIESAIIKDTLYFGKFFFSPHSSNDGGFSITWQE